MIVDVNWTPKESRRALALAVALGLASTASGPSHAVPALPPQLTGIPTLIDEEGIRLGVRAIVETWEEPELQNRFGTSRGVMAGLNLGIPLHEFLVVDIELGFKRLMETIDENGESSGDVMDLLPMSLQAQGRLGLGSQGEIFLGLGPTLTPFRHSHPGTVNALNDDTATNGVKLAGEIRLGLRIDTGLIQPARAPGMGRQFKAVDFEGYVGRRFQIHPRGEGYDLAAWRLGLGLSFRF